MSQYSKMSCHKRSFHCFNAVGGEGSYKSSHPLEHHTTRLPRIHQHGMVAYHELEQECCLCSAYRHAQTLEDVENQLLPFYHAHPPYHHHHHHPHQYALSGPSGHEEAHSTNECHIHHQRYNKKIVLVKNSDPSFRKTIILHRRGLRSFGLFLEEVSELMQYHIRKLYTQEGCKIDSIQSLLQCPGVLICVGREPSHPLIMENFEKTSSYKLPKLSGKSRPTERTDGNEKLTTKTSIILPNLEDDKRATKHSVSSDKSVPDGRDSPNVSSFPPSGNGVREDDIEKRVYVNKDGSLSMEMKVRFRLPNDETLHWSTKVKKTAGRAFDHIKGHNNPNLAQISDVNYSESEIMSADEAYFTQHYQGHKEKPHCPYCCSHCQGYETWKNVPGTHGASRCSHTSSSSASSHTVVSRKTVIEKQTMSRSSEELVDQVVETYITQSIEAAEMVEFCTIQRETCSPKCNVKPSTVENGENTGLYNFPKNLDLKTAQESDQKAEEQAGSDTCASQIFTGDEEKADGNDGSFSQISNPDRQETTGSEVLDTELHFPHRSQVSKDKASKTSGQHTKLKTSKPSYICHCGELEGVQIEPKEKNKTTAGAEGQMQRDESSAMSVKSDASWSSNKPEEIQKVECIDEGRRSKSAMSVNSNASTNCKSAVSDVVTEGLQAGNDKETKERTSSSLSMKSFKSSKSVKEPPVQYKSEEDVETQAEDDSALRTQSSLSALSSVSAELKNIAQEASEEEDNQITDEENKDSEPRVKRAISKKSNGSRSSRTPEHKTKENLVDNQVEGGIRPSLMSATSGKSTVSPTSRKSVRATSALSAKSRDSKTPELYVTKKAEITEKDNTEGESELRPQSKLSAKSEKSVKSNISAKSSKSKTSDVTHDESCDNTKNDYCNITETPDTSEARASTVESEKSVGSKSVTPTKQNACRDDGATVERAGSVMSVKSGKSHTSVVSLKSEASQVSTTHSGNLCDERNYLHATAGRSSCMSDKSIKSNISGRSSNLNGCDNLNNDDAANEEQRGPSAMSAKSAKSDVTNESTLSKASGKSNLSKPSDAIAEGNSGDHTEQRERAPSNMSTASAKSSKSHASAACVKEDASEVCCNPSEGIFSEEEIEERSVGSMSVQSVKSNISLRSGRTNCSTCTQAADATELFLQDSEEMNPEKLVESQIVRSASAMSATSTKSKCSTKSTKSNISNMSSCKRPGADTSEEAIQERVPSVLSVKSSKSATSIEPKKSKCSVHAQEKSSNSSGQENDKELLQERPTSRESSVSERSVKSTERPHSALSDKSKVSDIESVTSVEISDKGDCENATEQRAESALSTKTVMSTTSAKSTKSTKHDGLNENIANPWEMVERASSNMSARSEKSTKSNISTISKRSNVAAGCLEVVYPDERVVEGESECRSVSSQSVDSTVSTKSNKSMHSGIAEVEDDSLPNEEEKHKHYEERPPSSISTKSVQSCMSEISTKSAERTQSSLSAKSLKSSTTEVCSEKCPDESNIIEETQTRADSVLSSKTERSASSAKSNKSKGQDSRADENMVDDDRYVERSPSNLSVRSDKSTKSNASKGGKRLKVSKICLKNEAANPEERAAEDGSEDKSLSPQSVRSNVSVKSNKSKCCIDAPVAKNSDNNNSDNENDKETNIERPPSSTSTISVQSGISEMSIKSEERTASALSEKSHASVISHLTNISEVPSGRPALPDEVDSEDEERTTSVMSVKSINSSISDKSTKSARLDSEKHTERSSSNLSVKSGRSAKSNASKRSEVYEVHLENSADNSDVRIVEGESEGSTISVVSAQSVKSQCERFDVENENPNRPQSSTSAKSVLSHISEKSAKSAERPPSASSAKSAKSVKSNTSDAMFSKNVKIYDKGTESRERTNSALSSKTAKSATSIKSSKVNKHESPAEKDDGEYEDRNSSSMSAISITSAKSNISKVSQDSKACAKSGNEDDSQEEDNESSSMSSMSIHSVKSDISARSGMLKCSTDIPVQEIITRSDSPASVISIRSNSSGVFSDTNPTGERTDKKASQERSESAISTKSTISVKSNKSKVSVAPSEGCVCDLYQVERPTSNLSVKSAKSATSNVSGTSTKSKAFNTPSEHEQEITASDNEGEGNSSSSQVTKSNVSGCSKKSRCSDVAAAQSVETPNGDYSEETLQDRAESRTSVEAGCSHISERTTGSKASSQAAEEVDEHEKRKEKLCTLPAELAKSPSTESAKSVKSSGSKADGVPAEDCVAESNRTVERAASTVSDRSTKSKASTKSKRSTGGALGKENSKEENFERAPSCMSTSSVTKSVEQVASAMSSQTNISRISATVSQLSDSTPNEENINERSSSNISTNLKISSRVTTPCEITSIDNTSNGEEKAQRPPSTLSAKSAKSAKSSTSTKSSNLHISNKPCKEINVENVIRTPSNSSIKSTRSSHSDGGSNNSETLDISPENVASVNVENTEDIDIKPLSPTSAKSVKTNVSSVSIKSKASHSEIAKEEDQSQRTHSVLSIKSDTSSRTIQSNRSCITPREGIGNDEDNNDSMSETKPNKLIDPDIPKEEFDTHNHGKALVKSEGTQSPMSTKSPKSRTSCVPPEESSSNVEERAISLVSAKSDLSEALSKSEVPSVTIEESENRSPTATSLKSKASGRSKKSRTSEIQGAKSARKSQSSLSVHSHLSVKSKKTNVTDVSTTSMVSENTGEGGTPSEVKEGQTDKKSSKTNRSRGQGKEDAGVCLDKHPVICHADSAESDLSQTLSCSDKEICETSSPGKSKSHVSNRIANGSLEATDIVSEKSDEGSKHKKKNTDAGDFELVPSTLPNASPTEVVNEWLKTLPTERDLYEMEELNDGDGVKDNDAAEETNKTEDAEKNEPKAENSKEVNGMDNVQNDDSQTHTEAPNEDNTCTQREDGSNMFNSSIQVMKVLLNPKLDRCNSLPEISPVYGRKLSTSAQGLLDCLVKLQLIDHDPENANEKNERYQELMSILQSLWPSSPSEKEHVQNTNDHYVEGEYNHTSSSGVDVNSGSTGSGKSSDGVKSSNNINAGGSHPQNSLIEKAYNETDAQWKPEIEEVNQEEEDAGTDETIRSNDSPREPPETPSSSSKSSGESSSNDEKLSKKLSQDPDPVWVLTLLNKIEKQFMTHYISAMKELKVRWSLGDTNQLDTMIEELKTEVQKKIQISIDREVRKIQGRARLPRPPNEAISRTSTKQTEERRQRVKIKLQQSMDSQGEKSDSTTGTSYSDQRGENIDEYCPCETCVEKKNNSIPPLLEEVGRTAPVVMDYDLKRILLMKTAIDCAAPCGNDNDTTTAETLVEKVIVGAIKEVKSNNVQKIRDEAFEFPTDEKEEDNACQDDQATIEETVKVFAVDSEEKIGKAGAERPGSESGATYTVGEKTSEVETASEEGTDNAVTPGEESGFNVNIKTAEKDTDMLRSVSEDEDEEEITETMSSKHKYITATTIELHNHANEVHDDSDAFANTEVQSKEETEQDDKNLSVEKASSTKQEAGHKEAKNWLKLKRKLLPSMRIILKGKNKEQSMMNTENKDTVTINEMVKHQTEEEESEDEIYVVQETTVLSENESSEEVECSQAEDKEPAVEVNVAQTTDVKSSEEEDEESFIEMGSNATLSEDEKEVIETSSVATSEHGSEKEKIVEQTPVATLTDQKPDMEEARECTGTTSDHDSVEESGGSSDEDETEDEKEDTINELSSIQEEETTDDELSVTSEAELKKNQITEVGYEDAKKNNEAESEVQTSEKEEVEEDSIVDQEDTISPYNSNDSPDESQAAIAESSEEPDEGATTEDDMDAKKQAAVTGEYETVIAANPDQESDYEKAEEAGQVNPQEYMATAEDLNGSSTKSEDENEESETVISEHKSEKDAAREEGTETDEEKLPAVSADEFADENRDSSTEDESSAEHNKGATTEDEISNDKEIVVTQNSESKDEIAKDETVGDETENEISEEAGTIDDEETGTASESDSAEDINGTTNDDDTAEENDAMSSELSIEYSENHTKDEQTGKEATVKGTSVHKFEEAEEEEAVDCKEQTSKVKNRHDLGHKSEAEDDHKEDETDADTTENESGKDAVEEASSRQGSDSEDETNEEKEDKLKEEKSIEITDAEEEDMVKSKSDSAESNDAFSNDETSAAETEHEISKAYNVSNEKEPEETTDGEESDISAETDPVSTIEGSSKAVSENESEEEGNSSAIDDEKSVTNLRAGTGETTGQEDISTVKDDDELGDKDSEAKSEVEIVDASSQEYTDENQSLSQAEPIEQVLSVKEIKSSGKVEESNENVQEEKNRKDGETSNVEETPLEESESVENESDSESKCEDCSEAVPKGHEHDKITDEDLSETEMIDSENIKSDSGKKSRSKDACEGEGGCEESADVAEDGSVEEKEPQFTESQDATMAALNDNVKDSEKEDEDTDTPNEGWSGRLGDSADGEDEAEEDSEPEEDTDDGEKPFVADKLGSLDATKTTAKKTLLIPLDTLIKERAESEDGAYADIEDSETEIHGQDNVTSLESKGLKKV